MAISFSNSKRSEIVELQNELSNTKLDKRIEALKKVNYLINKIRL